MFLFERMFVFVDVLSLRLVVVGVLVFKECVRHPTFFSVFVSGGVFDVFRCIFRFSFTSPFGVWEGSVVVCFGVAFVYVFALMLV